jgi:putative addiction module component (TIGR02574 family)
MKAEHVELLNLSPSERLLLVQDLWDSLDADEIPLTEEQKRELDRRKVNYQANPSSGRSWKAILTKLSIY